jgi:hypothetical protein
MLSDAGHFLWKKRHVAIEQAIAKLIEVGDSALLPCRKAWREVAEGTSTSRVVPDCEGVLNCGKLPQ